MEKAPDECDGIKGMLQFREPDTGMWISAAYEDPDKTRPAVFDCRHQAERIKLKLMLLGALLQRTGLEVLQPKDEDFRFVPVEVPKELDTAVSDMSQACGVIDGIKKSLSHG
jgi:hypothetical protein